MAIDDSEDEDDDDDEDDEEGGDEDEEEEESDGEDGDVISGLPVVRRVDDDDQHMRGPASYVDDTGGLGKSFGGMSISPARPREIVAS